ncbi:MAG: rRNA-associated protein [Candidatus Berkelbacteria bacterium]|nr:rRNA-associated protein [Candidatus Berkelbacteria bacterium]
MYILTKEFCAKYLDPIKDRRLIEQMESCGRSIKQNIAEGHGRGDTKANLDFLGFSMGSLTELLEDYFDLEKDIKEGRRKTRNNEEAQGIISKAIKLLMGEKTMLSRQMEGLQKRFIQKGDEKDELRKDRQDEQKRQIVNNWNRKNWS